MDTNFPEPAGQIQPAETLSVLAIQIKAEHAANERDVRTVMLRAKKIGEWLNEAKSRSAHGQWLDWLKKNIPFGAHQAAKYMRIAINWSKLDPGSNLSESLRFLADEYEEKPQELNPQPFNSPATPYYASSSPNTPAPANKTFCPRCQRVGPIKDCPQCAVLHKPQKPEEPAMREPGDDTDENEAEKAADRALLKNGQVLWDWKPFNSTFGGLVRLIDIFGNNHRCNQGLVAQGLRRKLDEWRKDFLKWVRDVTKKPSPES